MLNQPTAAEVWLAIETYLRVAYEGSPSRMISRRIDALKATPAHALLNSGEFERVGENARALRLGNRHYPHMKLVIEPRPDGAGALFRVDTHDGHCRPAPDSADFAPFCQLMVENERVARAVEEAWAKEGIPTFKRYLREDLERRRQRARH